MAKAELDPNWWKKNAPKSLSSGEVHGALEEVHKKSDVAKTGDHAGFFKALDKLKVAIAKDEKAANTAKDKAAAALLADLKKAHDDQRGKTEGHLKIKGEITAKGLGGKSGVAVPALKGKG